MIQIVAWEEEGSVNERWYSYDAAGSLAGETIAIAGSNPTHSDYANLDNSHLDSVILPSGSAEDYAYDHLNRRVAKEGPSETLVYHYDLQGNLIGESLADGTILREWVYLGNQRLAMILPAEGGGGGGCESPSAPDFPSCSVLAASQSSGAGAGAVLLLLGPAFIAIGLKFHRRKYTILGLTFIGGLLFLVLMPNAQSQTPAETIYYYHNDHLGTPRVLTDQTGAVVWDVDYTPFGEISAYVTNTLPVDQPFRFPGQYNDAMTGHYYNWNRYYMPEVGRYNRVDPLDSASLIILLYRLNTIMQRSNNFDKCIDLLIITLQLESICQSALTMNIIPLIIPGYFPDTFPLSTDYNQSEVLYHYAANNPNISIDTYGYRCVLPSPTLGGGTAGKCIGKRCCCIEAVKCFSEERRRGYESPKQKGFCGILRPKCTGKTPECDCDPKARRCDMGSKG